MSGRRDVDLLERCVARNLAVGDAVLCHAAGNADFIQSGDGMQSTQHMENHFLCIPLHRRRQIHVVLGQFVPFLTPWAEQVDELLTEQRRHHGQVVGIRNHTVLQVEMRTGPLEQSAFFQGQNLRHLVHVLRISVRGQSHDLVFIAVMRKPQVLCECGIKQAHAVREIQRFEHFNLRAFSARKHRRRKIPRSVDAQNGSLLKRRREKRAAQMTAVVFDEAQFAAYHVHIHSGLYQTKLLVQQCDVVFVGRTLVPQRLRNERMLQDKRRFVQLLRRRIAANGDGGDILELASNLAQAKRDGFRWKAGPMLDAPKAFLLRRRHEHAVHENCRR